ncbi:MAG TPA: serine protease [Patescibacteria group bacterium]|nr:serine protease [Patescibacteria group bacterium]
MAMAFFAAAAFAIYPVAASADPPHDADPAGSAATYRVTVDPDLAGTGIAVSTEGWVITTADLVRRCPPAPAHCGIWVDDAARQIWRRAELIASDPQTCLALLHPNARLPAAASLASRPARAGEPVHAYAFDGNDRLFLPGNVVADRPATLFGDPPASGRVLVSTLECRAGTYGTAIFATADGRLLGVIVGIIDGQEGGTVAIPGGTVRTFFERNRALYERRARTAQAVH